MAPPVVRPDNVLKRAEELIAVDNEEAALQILHEFLTSKRTRSVTPAALEPIALLFAQLSVDLRRGFTLKDGLHQFKKNVQISPTGLPSVEIVARKLVELAEKKLETAKAKADERAVDSLEDDLEVDDSPEDILMSAVSNEQSKDRADRELVTPWVRFLWESFRLVLDLLRNNSRLEVTYSAIVQQAYQFCLKYNRKTEFRRLCELLRSHIQNATFQQKTGARTVNAVDFQDPETLQRSLDLRFVQLNVSVKLELWQEAFRSVEDIHTLITISKRLPKPTMMVNFYEQLAKIFLVSGNGLFHAAAWHRFYNLYSQSPNATEEELSRYSSIFLLSTLAIPQELSNFDELENKHSTDRLTSLLNLPKVPTRVSLLQAALNKNVYDYVDPSIKKLYTLLETDFHPLSIRDELNEATQSIESNESYAAYVEPLTQVVLTRLFEQVAQVYETIKIEFLIKLATFKGKFQLSPLQIEGFLLNAGKEGRLFFYIDHDSGVITFRNDPFDLDAHDSTSLQPSPSQLIRSQLSGLASTLYKSLKFVEPGYAAKQEAIRQRLISDAIDSIKKERDEIAKHRKLLEDRKLQLEQEKKEREIEFAKERQRRMEEEKAAEAARVEAEAERRLQEKIKREQAAVEQQQKKKLIEDINAKGIIKIDADKVDELDAEKLRIMQIEQLEKDKSDIEERTKALFKKMDHTERAFRNAEIPILEKDSTVQQEEDRKNYEAFKEKRIAIARKDHEIASKLRDRLKKALPDYTRFKNEIDSEATARREAALKELHSKLEAAKQKRIDDIRQERYQQKLAEYQIELDRQAEEEAAREAEEAKKAEQELKFEQLKREREERAAVNKEKDVQAAKQREIEALIEAKLSGKSVTPAASSSSPSPSPAAGNKPLTYAEKLKLKRKQREQAQQQRV